MASSSLRIRQHREARTLWYASAGNAAALWMVQIAVSVHVLQHHSVATLAVVGLVGGLPAVVCTPVAGIFADRYDVRRITTITMAGQVLCLSLMLVFGSAVVILAALYAIQGVLNSFWAPARQRWLYGVLPAELRHPANATIGSIDGLMMLVGATAGGLLSSWNPLVTFGVAAICQAAAWVQVRRTAPPELVVDFGKRGLVADLRDGVRAARDFPLARSVIWIGVAWGFVGGGYSVLLAGHVQVDLRASAFLLGVVYASDGMSVMVATVLAGKVRRTNHLAVYAAAYVVQGVAWASIFLSGHIALVILCVVVMRFAGGYIIALDMSILLETVPDHLRGRVTSLHLTTYSGVGRISLAVLGGLLTIAGITTVGIAAGVASAVFGLSWWLISGRHAKTSYLSAVGAKA